MKHLMMSFELSRRPYCRLGAAVIGIASIVLLGLAPPARASLLFSVQSVSASPGDVNDLLQVDVTNAGPAAIDPAAYSFTIQTSSSDITFEQATTATLFPYVFAGNSFFGPVTSTSGPGQSLSASDLPANFNATVIGAGFTFGLGEVSFDVALGAPAEVLPIEFNTSSSSSTSALDPNGSPIPLNFSNGEITIGSATPLPATLPLFATGLSGLGLLVGWRRKRKARAV
jgi:hypothetical protein